MKTRLMLASMLAFVGATAALALGAGPSFDSLKDDDRKAMQERFAKELWPLMQRGEKNSCVGCHSRPKTGGQMKLTGKLETDFPMLVKVGFFLPNDSGSILAHVASKDRKQRMPPPGAGDPWTEKEIAVLQNFVADLDKKQQKKSK